MSKFKKLFVLLTSLLLFNSLFYSNAGKFKFVVFDNGGEQIALHCTENKFNTIIQSVTKRLEQYPNERPPILCNTNYNNDVGIPGYDKHHIVITSTLKKHGFSTSNAPCVFVREDIHRLTGSYGNSNVSIQYRQNEDELFRSHLKKCNDSSEAMQRVCDKGIDDLVRACNEAGYCITNTTPVRERYRATFPLKSKSLSPLE